LCEADLRAVELGPGELEPEPVLVLPVLVRVVECRADSWWVADEDWALAAPGRTRATAPPATMLAAPMAAVTARIRPWSRLLAAMAARTRLRSVPTGFLLLVRPG
jgi:hypothetical protein